MIAKKIQSFYLVIFVYEHRNIVIAASVRNHSHRYSAYSIKNFSFKSCVLPL